MTTENRVEEIRGLPVMVVRKPIKHLHLGVYPPDGHVRISVPTAVTDPAVRLAIIDKLGWIRRQQARFREQARESAREMVSGETHWYLGQRYRLKVIEIGGRTGVRISARALEIRCRPGSTRERRAEILDAWYRARLRELLPPLIERWAQQLEVEVAGWQLKRMKTKWGSCNATAGRVWFNVELAKKPQRCLEYTVVHELVHLIDRHHGAGFIALMDHHLPKWRSLRQELGQLPLGGSWWGDS
jgi:predicted metal-dependent hydrolase